MSNDDYGDGRWDDVDPHAAYLRNLPAPEPVPEWMQHVASAYTLSALRWYTDARGQRHYY